jgi:peptidoglycan-N-acetylmuramic acid deacetylase
MRRGIKGLLLAGACSAAALAVANTATPACTQPVYLTFDTGHMEVAPLIAEVLKRHHVKATFFLANERTKTNGSSLDDIWAPWWRERVAEGHAFGSHTWDHTYWRADTPGGSFKVRPSQGPRINQESVVPADAYCAELKRPAARLAQMSGQPNAMSALFRAPGGKTSPALLQAARQCGFSHVGWADAGFLGDELPSSAYPNAQLLQKALKNIRAGDVLMAHLGIWSRQDPWAPAVLEPLITGLKARGLCFATLRDHPTLGAAARSPAPL